LKSLKRTFKKKKAIQSGDMIPVDPSQMDGEEIQPRYSKQALFGGEKEIVDLLQDMRGQLLTLDIIDQVLSKVKVWKLATDELVKDNDKLFKENLLCSSQLGKERKNVDSLLDTISNLQEQLKDKTRTSKFSITFLDAYAKIEEKKESFPKLKSEPHHFNQAELNPHNNSNHINSIQGPNGDLSNNKEHL